jgi:uncharacterized OsmC-like protein
VGEIEKDGNVLIIKRIHVTYQLKADESDRATAERVLGFHASHCPVARSIEAAIDITTSLELQQP